MVTGVKPDVRLLEAIEKIQKAGFTPELPQQFQLKVGRFNYYWSTGKITVDSGPRIAETGIDAFIALLKAGGSTGERYPAVQSSGTALRRAAPNWSRYAGEPPF